MLKNIDHKNVIHYGKDAVMVLSRKDDYSGSTCLKVLNEEFPTPDQLRHFENEFIFGSLGSLHCTRKVIEKKLVENHQALVFEYIEGQNLQRYLTGLQLSFSQKINMASELAAAVADIQKENIFHGQLCLENIIVEKGTEKIFLIDFSEACYQDEANMEMTAQKKFRPAMLPYLAPEQSGRINRSIDARADLYSLGVLLYRIFTGQVPFSGADTMDLMYSHMARIPTNPAVLVPDLPEPIAAIIMKLLAKNAEDRYQSAFGVHYDLEHCAAAWHANNNLPPFELGTNDFSGRFYPRQKLYGRETALKTLFGVFEESAAGNKRMLMVSGYSGSGKSSLIAEVQQPVLGEKGLFITGKFDPLQTDAPYSGFVQAFTELSNHILAESPTLQDDWKERIRKGLGANGGLLSEMVPGIGALIGPQEDVPELKGTEAQNRFRYTLLNFIKASARQDQPLVIFLDDLQWADDSSLNLLMVLMEEHALHHFMIIGAYRSNEVGEDHALTKLFRVLQAEGIYYDEINLGELAAGDVLQLVEDMLHTGQADAGELADIVCAKTKGNAFYVQQFLRSVYEEKLLFFDFGQRKWIWKKELISEMNVSGNVVDLMTSLVNRLSPATVQLLKTAACIGNRFEKRILSIAGDVSEKQVQQLLAVPLSDGLILGGGNQFKFAHDRIQQSVYSLMGEEEKKQLHLRIGKAWSSITLEAELPDRIFDIVNQWNIAAELADSADTRFYLAGLNLIAARRAIVTTAYSQALQYYEKGLTMVDDSYWTGHYGFILDLTAEAAEAAYLCGEFGKVDAWVEAILQKSKSLTDLTKGYEISIKKLIAQNKLQDAIRLGLAILEKMGVRFPLHPAKATTVSGLLLTKWAIRGKDADYFTSLPEMTDQEKNAMMRILSDISSAAYFAAPDLVPLLIFKMIRLTVQHGISRKSPYSFAAYGFILSAHMGEIDNGIKYGQVALNMAKQLRADELNGSILTINNVFLKHWRKPLRDTMQELEEAFTASLNSGDHEWGSYAAQNMAYQLFVAGYPLKELAKRTLLLDQQIEKFRQALTIRRLRLFRQSIHHLVEPTATPEVLKGDIFDEDELTEADISENNKVYFHNLYFQKAFLALVFNETDHAAAFMTKAGQYLESVRGSSLYPLFYFYESLVITGHGARKLSGKDISLLQKNLGKMRQYEKFCAANYLHKRLLLEAEYERTAGDHIKAKSRYDSAIKAASEQAMLHDLALCWERAAMFFIDTHEEVLAKFYLQNAFKAYQQWGAANKLRQMARRYPQLDADTVAALEAEKNAGLQKHLAEELDMNSVIKASSALAGEIVLGRLLEKLVSITIESAGAQSGFVIIERSGNLFIEAEAHADGAAVQTLQSLPVKGSGKLAESVVNYVYLTQEVIILDNAVYSNLFANDEFVKVNRPKSILCLPLMNQGKLQAIIYLANDLMAGAFTEKRLALLKLLAGQIAVSIENALFYSDLEEKVKSRTIELRAEKQKSDDLLLNILPQEIADELKAKGRTRPRSYEQVTVMFTDFKDFTLHSEKLSPEELVNMVDTCFKKFDAITAKYHLEKIKTIGDAYLCVSGLPDPGRHDAGAVVAAALEIVDFVKTAAKEAAANGGAFFDIRIGIHTGPLVAGVVGDRKFAYDIWGDTVNIAARMEQNSETNHINISQDTYELVKSRFNCVPRGKQHAKNKGMIDMYFVESVAKEIMA